MMKIDKEEFALQWMAALLGGEYTQGRRALRKGEAFCCLGVACDLVHKLTGKGEWGESSFGFMPYEFAISIGIAYKQSFLAQLNDNGHGFTRIAKEIEEIYWGDKDV